RAVEFDTDWTQWMLDELALVDPQAPAPTAATSAEWREKWVAGQLELLQDDYELPLWLTVQAPGVKAMLNKAHRLRNLFKMSGTPPWRDLSVIEVNARGDVAIQWDTDLVQAPDQPNSPAPSSAPQPAMSVRRVTV